MAFLGGCASMSGPQRPQFYPNDEYRNRGAASANRAADECMAMADQYVEQPEAWKEALKTGAAGAAIGAGTGAVGGVITKGSVGRTTAAGAAIGGIVGVLAGLKDVGVQSPSYQRFVEHCLQKQGYEVVGWGN